MLVFGSTEVADTGNYTCVADQATQTVLLIVSPGGDSDDGDDYDDDDDDDDGDDAAPKEAFVFCFLGTAPDHQSHYPLINGSDLFSLHRASWHDTHPTEGEVSPNCFGEYSSSFYTCLVSGNSALVLQRKNAYFSGRDGRD